MTVAVGPWLLPYLLGAPRRRAPRPGAPVHVLLCIADHYEPQWGKAAPAVARARVRRWAEEYPRRLAAFLQGMAPSQSGKAREVAVC